MKFIEDQIDVAMSAVKVQKPVIKLVRGYSGGVRMDLNNAATFDEPVLHVDQIVLEAVRNRMSVKLNLESKKYTVRIESSEVVGNILSRVEDHALHFLANYGGFANNRLSKIYKWFRDNVDARAMRNHEKLAQDMYNVVKFANGLGGDSKDAEKVKTARSLFLLIKDRYEPIIGSL